MTPDANLHFEQAFARELQTADLQDNEIIIAGMDEVGRGALAGPVTVGVVAVNPLTCEHLPGLKDSKKLTAARREALTETIAAWAFHGIGSATAQEIDRYGLSTALGLAGLRALEALISRTGRTPDGLILDGRTNWLQIVPAEVLETETVFPVPPDLQIRTLIKADAQCSTVAAASIMAKVSRDSFMTEIATEFPAYQWQKNKGYGSAVHREAIGEQGASPYHRTSWHLTP